MLNKAEFIKYWVDRNKVSQSEAKNSIEQFIDTLKSAVSENGKVNINGFLTVEIVNREARVCKNPRNQNTIKTTAKRLIKLKISPKFKNMLEE